MREGNLFLAKADGSDTAMILDLAADIDRPTWSPNGLWIGFDEAEPQGVAVVHSDGTSYQRLGEDVRNTGFAPVVNETLLLTTAVHPQNSGESTASWYVTAVPYGAPNAIVVPGISPDQMPLSISWRPPEP